MRSSKFMTRIDRIVSQIDRLSGFAGWLGAACIVLMIPLISYEVFMRYVLHRPPMVADEFSAYLLVGCVFLGLAYTLREEGHIRVEVLISRLNRRTANWIRVFALTVALVVIGIGVETGVEFELTAYKLGLRSESWLMVPEYIPKLFLPLGFLLFLIQILAEIRKVTWSLKGRDRIHFDGSGKIKAS